ncbi:shikimate kinase [Selenihalanaerobacter shriftii]|uniref:Shikimate kinase n=1 Tax=Selenihalanaerobacter shriftii TaxID=142842 RepID=A0A1T4P3V4_9FIRM|nr:shikimate kinase [Selenihalanaerobacter shriftii]SJZ85997.1 shikimate kinase [Selenihalanaerobacter shriftii]
MSKNIVLIGFMGTGKSTVGKELADKLGMKFVDSDEVIKEDSDKTIEEIFAEDGEDYFRNLETKVISDLSQRDNLVISTGGGVVLKENNIKLLNQNGIVILLTATPEVILMRVKNTDRPLLQVEKPLEKIKELLAEREEFYNIAKYQVDTSSLEVDEVIKKIEEIIIGSEGD